MELTLNLEQLQLKSEYIHTNPSCTHYHEDIECPLFVSWNDCVSVLYFFNDLAEASLWNPVEPVILPISNPILSILTFDSKVYCIDKIGTIYHLKQIERDSPDLFGCSPPSEDRQKLLSCNYEWISIYSQICPCDVLGTTYCSDGIALIAVLGEWIILQLLKITINDNNEPIVLNTCIKQIRPHKQFPFLVSFFVSCTWKHWFSNQRARELFEPNVLNSQDIFLVATEESKIYCMTSDLVYKNVSLFSSCPQKIVHIQFCDFESKMLILVSSSGILTVIPCAENSPSSFIYLAVTKVVAVFIYGHTVILSDGVNLFLITLDKQFSKIVKQVVTPLKGVLTIHKFQFSNIIVMTQLNKVYKLSPKYEVFTQEEDSKFIFNEKSILGDIKDLCKSIESLDEQRELMNKYINAVSIVARKDLVAQYCSLNVLIYSGAKAVKLGALQDEYIFAIKLSTECSWLSFSSTIWKLMVRVTDNTNSASNCGLHSFDINLFNNCHPVMVKHHLLSTVAENCTSGMVYCELVCQLQNDLINKCLVIPLCPVKLNSLYFIEIEKREKIPVINPLIDRHKYIFKLPEHLSMTECLNIITNKNKHRTSKSLYTSIINNIPKTLYLNFFGKIITVVFDDKISKTIILESIDRNALVAIRDGVFTELSNDQPAIINYSVLADVQKQLCLLEELSLNDRINETIVKEIKTKIQNQISAQLPV